MYPPRNPQFSKFSAMIETDLRFALKVNQSTLILAVSVAILCAGWVWLARKKRRESGPAPLDNGPLSELTTPLSAGPQEQVAGAVVPPGEAGPLPSCPTDEAEERDVRTKPGENTDHEVVEPPESRSTDPAGPVEDGQTPGAKGGSAEPRLIEGGSVPRGGKGRSGLNQKAAPDEANHRQGNSMVVVATNGEKPRLGVSQEPEPVSPFETKGIAGNGVVEGESRPGPAGRPKSKPEEPAGPEPPPVKPPKYPGLRPIPPGQHPNEPVIQPPGSPPAEGSALNVRVHLVFDRRGSGVRSLSLIPGWHRGMPADLEVTGTQGDFVFRQLEDSCRDVVLPDIGAALREGVTWMGEASGRRWHWVLSRREIHVLVRGDDVGVSGFVSVPRLLLDSDHVVLATKGRRTEVLAALTEAGCAESAIMDESAAGVPAGWLLFHGVTPTRPVQGHDEADILNALRPLAEIVVHFAGGIRLAGRTWLHGHPPRIRFTGDPSGEPKVTIDGESASVPPEGGFIAPGWDSVGRHSLWCTGRLWKYRIRRGAEDWNAWNAYDFATGAAICGPCMRPKDTVRCHQVRVFLHNPVLVGAVPGEIFRCNPRVDMRTDSLLLFVPFAPVWALPADPLHADKSTARILVAGGLRHVLPTPIKTTGLRRNRAISAWCAVINDAGRKGLALATEEARAGVLWKEYRRAAKQEWRKIW